MKDVSILQHIREVRHRISQECGHDPKRLIEYYMRLQERHKERLLKVSKSTDQANESPLRYEELLNDLQEKS